MVRWRRPAVRSAAPVWRSTGASAGGGQSVSLPDSADDFQNAGRGNPAARNSGHGSSCGCAPDLSRGNHLPKPEPASGLPVKIILRSEWPMSFSSSPPLRVSGEHFLLAFDSTLANSNDRFIRHRLAFPLMSEPNPVFSVSYLWQCRAVEERFSTRLLQEDAKNFR